MTISDDLNDELVEFATGELSSTDPFQQNVLAWRL